MLPIIKTDFQRISAYKNIVPDETIEEIFSLAETLKGVNVFHVNSTAQGGGVAEILKNLVPLMKGVGIKASWYTIPAHDSFFNITKKIHNASQGGNDELSQKEKEDYLSYTKHIANLMEDMTPDIWIIHDFQPAGAILNLPNLHPSALRIHIDLTSPNKKVWNFISPIITEYDKIVVSSHEFIKEEIKEKAVEFCPAIDPLNLKNRKLSLQFAKKTLENFGIDCSKPLVSQISRFDIWKDPIGAIEAYRLAKRKIPDLQLALVGFILARDDPEAERVYKKVIEETKNDPDIFVFADPKILEGLEVDTFTSVMQLMSNIVLQKSIREGFGLTVTEAMWKGKTVIAGNVGGIKKQIKSGENGFLVSSSEEASSKIIKLIEDPDLCEKIGKAAKETVRENFLVPRLLKDYLRLIKEILEAK